MDYEHRKVNITGRDNYIVAQALGYAIVCIEGLPRDKQELGNRRYGDAATGCNAG